MTFRAHSKSEYKRMVAQGANVLPPSAPTPGQIHFEFENQGYGLFWDDQDADTKVKHERIAAAVIAHARGQIKQAERARCAKVARDWNSEFIAERIEELED